MPAGHIHRRLMGGAKEDVVSYAYTLMTGGSNDSHWPMSETSWDGTVGEIAELLAVR